MGIQGLLPFVQNACRRAHVSEFSGTTVAIDGHCWLHRAAYACAEKLVKGQTTTQYVAFCLKFIDMLRYHQITPIVVFDGNSLPAKKEIHLARKLKRTLMKQKGEIMESEGNFQEARSCFNQGYEISPSMVSDVIKACREKGVDCLVAPFEADAQLTYMLNQGFARFVITEDSDLIAFGCKRILFKMDGFGNGLLYERRHLHKCLGGRATLLLSPGKSCDEMLFTRFRYACILSGCDYHPGGLSGIGLQKASKAVMSCSNIMSIDRMLSRLPQYMNNMHLVITTEYKANFARANYTFLYQIVFDPMKRKLVPLNSLPSDLRAANLHFAGHGVLADDLAMRIAMGVVMVGDMNELSRNDSFSQALLPAPSDPADFPSCSIWSPSYRLPPRFKSPTKTPPIKRRVSCGEVTIFDNPPLKLDDANQELPPESLDDTEMSTASTFKRSLDVFAVVNAPLAFGSAKRKILKDPSLDDISTPATPKKRLISWSAPAKSLSFPRASLTLRGHRESGPKCDLFKQSSLVESSYFAQGAMPNSNQRRSPSPEEGFFSGNSSGNTLDEGSAKDDDIVVISEVGSTGLNLLKPTLTPRTVGTPLTLTSVSLQSIKKFGLHKLAYKKPAK